MIGFLEGSSKKTEMAPRHFGSFFGLRVEVICRMESYSLIRYRDREFIVSTEDLQSCLVRECAAA